MLVKVFESEDMPSALKMVRETLGSEALILSTRTVRKGMGVFRKPIYEVTAAIDDVAPAAASNPLPAKTSMATIAREQDDISYQEIWKQRKVLDPLEDEVRDLKRQLAHQSMATVREELDELKSMVRQMSSPAPTAMTVPAAARPARKTKAPRQDNDIQEMGSFRETLAGYGIVAEAAEAIEQIAWETLSPQQMQDPHRLQMFFREAIQKLIRVAEPLHPDRQQQKRIALVGPTGVGKTTTIAKLAAHYLLHERSRIALVTIDTYRIAAVEQLKVYGEIMNLPVEVVLSPEQLQQAFARHRDKDLILIDTAGRSPRDEPSLEELCRFLGPEAGVENHLVLAVPTRERELQETVSRFSLLPLHNLIFTKIDECEQRGSILNVPLRHNLPVSYLTDGQRVPEDLVVAKAEYVADFIARPVA